MNRGPAHHRSPLESERPADWVALGRVSGVFGVRGWIKVFSYTSPRARILEYSPWYLCSGESCRRVDLPQGRPHGKGVVASIEGVEDRDAAAQLIDSEIGVRRRQFEALPQGEFYWADLEGLRVVHSDGTELGVVDHLLETGANDVLVLRGNRERLVPFVLGRVVLDVSLDAGCIRVDWDPDF